jgi:hypothetical protein
MDDNIVYCIIFDRVKRNFWALLRYSQPETFFNYECKMNYPAASCEVSLWWNSSILSKQASRNSPGEIKPTTRHCLFSCFSQIFGGVSILRV